VLRFLRGASGLTPVLSLREERQQSALCRHWQEMEADVRRLVTPSFINDAIRNGIDYVTSNVLH